MSLKKLFHSSGGFSLPNHYSSTIEPELSSTTFVFASSEYCIHCGAKALPIQDGSMLDGYVDCGMRCDCDAAFNEMASLIALDINDFDKEVVQLRSFNSVPDEILKKVIGNMKSVSIHYFSSSNNGKIKHGNASSSRFLYNHSHEIKYHLNDEYRKNDPIVMFLGIIQSKFETFVVRTKLHYENNIAKFNETSDKYFPTKEKVK
jgi:hypothetical protein